MTLGHTVRETRRGLTHVEMVVATVMGGLFVATLLPEPVGTPGDGRRSSLEEDLEMLRTAVEMYRYEHAGTWPAAGTTDAAVLQAALLVAEEGDGRTRGAYLNGKLPENPFNGLRTVRVVTDATLPEPDDTTGWTYSSTSGALAANSSGCDGTGRRIADR